MTDPAGLELQKAIVARLKADADVTALVAGRVYDLPPPQPTFPYVTVGGEQTVPDRAECYDGDEISFQVDAWSRSPGFPEVKRIAGAVRAALTYAELTLSGHRLVDLALVGSRAERDPDGFTNHAALSFVALTEPV